MNYPKLAPFAVFTLTLAFLSACATTKKAGDASSEATPKVVTSAANKGGMSPVTPERAPQREPVVNSAANKGGSSPVTPPAKGSAEETAANTQEVAIVSVPAGAAVTVNDQSVGVTPLAASLDVTKAYTVTLKLPGYYIETIPVSAVSISGGGYMSAKGGAMISAGSRMPSEIKAKLTPVTDKYVALTTTVAALDSQLKAGKITPAQHKQMVADAVKFYGQ